ncbi:MAG TPA: transporter substrate-binding domain-containing protein [Kiritimatiellia bacterium]|nr:transporter substrate-binding domain-containing protein [Kiritimatiellia bacterium]HRZ13015.1 transporter substrate-binding domain-containing protein [Kiritimatiellia bacterium]HSA18375.1 transporter substrate-binding domain-containing protein [Kiritimatiellia bacterium]
MPGRREWVVVALALLAACAESRSEAARIVRVGVYQNPPKIFINAEGRPDGLFVDLLETVAAQENWQLDFMLGSWADHLRALEEGRLDLLPDMAYSAERAARFKLSQIAVLSSWLEVFARHGLPLNTLDDLDGRRVAVLDESIQLQVIREQLPDLGIQVEAEILPSHDEVMAAVQEGRADAGIVNRFFDGAAARRYDVMPTAIIFQPTKLVFAAPASSDGQLLDILDKRLARLKKDRSSAYYRILGQWLGESAPAVRYPRWMRNTLIGLLALVVALGLLGLAMRRVIRVYTRDLRDKTRQLEEALHEVAKAHEEAIKQERLHALGRMASGIAHDFNNCLLSILGYSELMLLKPQAGPDDRAEIQHSLEMIRTAAQDAAVIVKRMQAFYRAQQGDTRLEPVDLNAVVRDAVELSRPSWKTQAESAGIRIHVETSLGQIPFVQGSPSELRDMLVNLIINAVHAIEREGTLRVSTSARGEWVALEVKDTGCGMTPEVRARCMDPFFTTKGEKGTGMGLAMVHGIVLDYQGKIVIDSEPGKGTTVTILLPISSKAAAPVPAARALPGLGPRRILVVDDDPRVLKTMSAMLRSVGHVVEVVSSAHEALDRMEVGRPDILLTDLSMPDMTGMDLLHEVRRRGWTLPCLILSGTPEVAQKYSDDPIPILRKPISLTDLNRALAEALASPPGSAG